MIKRQMVHAEGVGECAYWMPQPQEGRERASREMCLTLRVCLRFARHGRFELLVNFFLNGWPFCAPLPDQFFIGRLHERDHELYGKSSHPGHCGCL